MSELFDNNILQFTDGESDGEFIPLITAEEEENMNKQIETSPLIKIFLSILLNELPWNR